MPSSALVRSIASFSLALPGLERCDRPSSAALSASGVRPGRLAQGPDEKKGRAGRTAGFKPVIAHSFQNDRAALGRAWPKPESSESPEFQQYAEPERCARRMRFAYAAHARTCHGALAADRRRHGFA